jgi:hypothetical protein
LEFGKNAAFLRRQRGEGKPETFDFLGFTHICSVTRYGSFKLLRITIAKRMKAKLKDFKRTLRKRMHWDVRDVANWLERAVSGYYNYFAIHGNLKSLASFGYQLGKIWYWTICRRGQKRKMTWEKFIKKWWCRIPTPKVRHPYPEERFDVKHPKRSLSSVNCARWDLCGMSLVRVDFIATSGFLISKRISTWV